MRGSSPSPVIRRAVGSESQPGLSAAAIRRCAATGGGLDVTVTFRPATEDQ